MSSFNAIRGMVPGKQPGFHQKFRPGIAAGAGDAACLSGTGFFKRFTTVRPAQIIH